MNVILKSAIEAVEALAKAQQAEVAEEMLAYVDLMHGKVPSLDEAQIAGVKAAQLAVRNGEFASDSDVADELRTFER